MPATIHMKSGDYYTVDTYRNDIVKEWDQVLQGDISPLRTYDQLHAGIPLPKLTLNMHEISHVAEYRR